MWSTENVSSPSGNLKAVISELPRQGLERADDREGHELVQQPVGP